jgi:23S rRNA (cytidine2498-2'-O)-methyltransferase
LFSDIVCYPKRLLGLVQKWRQAGTVRRFVCTIKFQGATDVEAMRHFAAISGSQLLHLHHNKHELTWIHL